MKTNPDPQTTLKAMQELHAALVALGQAILDSLVEDARQIIDLFPVEETERDRQVARSRADVEAKRRAARIIRQPIRADSKGHQAHQIIRRNGTDRRGDK